MSEQSLLFSFEIALSIVFLVFIIFFIALVLRCLYHKVFAKNNADIAKSIFSVFYYEFEKDSETGEHYGTHITEYTGFESEEKAYEFFLRNHSGSKYDYYLIHEKINLK